MACGICLIMLQILNILLRLGTYNINMTNLKKVIRIRNITGLEINKLKLLGKGTQGRVYRIDSERCIKVFKKSSDCAEETKTLFMGQVDERFPKLYSAGNKYIIRECINGVELNKFLSHYQLTNSISEKILKLYDAMRKVNFNRLDSTLSHIFVTSEGNLKLIDTAKALRKKTRRPKLILRGLKKLGYKDDFLNYVKSRRPDLYSLWN
jgi:predicted Ser/Thr protein kinase